MGAVVVVYKEIKMSDYLDALAAPGSMELLYREVSIATENVRRLLNEMSLASALKRDSLLTASELAAVLDVYSEFE